MSKTAPILNLLPDTSKGVVKLYSFVLVPPPLLARRRRDKASGLTAKITHLRIK